MNQRVATPLHLVGLSLTGSLLVGGGLLGVAHRSGPFQWSTGWVWLAVSGLGAPGLIWPGYTLRRGLKEGRWPAAAVDSARRLTQHPLWTAGVIACLVAMLAIGAMTGGVGRGYFMSLFLFGQTMSQMRLSLRRDTDDPLLPPAMKLAPTASLRSEHWGER